MMKEEPSNVDGLEWPKSVPEMQIMENLLKCGICYEYLNVALITPCSHNFCSLCIRRFMQYKTTCPQCFAHVTETELKNNRVVDEMVTVMRRIKLKMNKATIQVDVAQNGPTSTPEKPKTPVKEVHKIVTSVSSPFLDDDEDEPQIVEQTESPIDLNKSIPKTPDSKGESRRPKSIMDHMSRSPLAGSSKVLPAASMVSCPICQVQIPERNINLHIDKCLERGNQAEATIFKPKPSTSTARRRLPKLVYSLMKEAELRKKCSEANLSTQGDKQTLIKRHRKYTLLYNSECDCANPRPVKDIVRQVEKEERDENFANCKTLKAIQAFKVDRKDDPKVIEQAQAKYRTENGNHFSKLVEELKKRKEKKKVEESKPDEPIPVKVVPENPPAIIETGNESSPSNSPGTSDSEMDRLLTQTSPVIMRKEKSQTPLGAADEENDMFSLQTKCTNSATTPSRPVVLNVSDDEDIWAEKSQTKKSQKRRSSSSQEEVPLRRSSRKRRKAERNSSQ
ncbi:E3 ubiquitin-protein ligase RAD18 isoform X2 [Neocloeon triangulifer]|uniref:E3 ubiquitin-protein ligase RAD18 isoform X2 n=1 Tax=Neocloeon triangulifer TaxID=2078957 RepID=UPI00286F7C5B|nr:E3 ubiquitin-protein ligase RAD18 isoform X2 [Neocloeon triangulifer]